MKRLILAAAFIAALATPAAAQAYQDCYPVAPHWGRPAPHAAYALHVWDWYGNPVPKVHENPEGSYYQRTYANGTPSGNTITIVWHWTDWISNYSGMPIDACFFVATPDKRH